MAKTIEQINLGADQLGQFYAGVDAALRRGKCPQTYITEVMTCIVKDVVSVKVIGSRGATLLAVLDDHGWEIEPVL